MAYRISAELADAYQALTIFVKRRKWSDFSPHRLLTFVHEA